MFALYERQLIPGAGCSWDTFVTPVLKSSVGVHKNQSKARRVYVSRKRDNLDVRHLSWKSFSCAE